MSGQLDPPPAVLTSTSLSQSRSTECAYELAGVAWVIRVVVTIPVDIPALSASVRIETTLLLSVIEEQLPFSTVASTPSTPWMNKIRRRV